MYHYDAGNMYHYLHDKENNYLTHESWNVTIMSRNNLDGGPGSGNWGHAGRPGKLGGSASGGGKVNRTGTKESGYSSKAQEKKLRKNIGVSPGLKKAVVVSGTTKEVQISGMKVKKSDGYYCFYKGADGKIEAEKADVYETPDGKQFVFKAGMKASNQSLTPEFAIEIYQNIPKNIRARGQDVISVVDYENYDDPYWRKKYKNFTSSYATGGNDEITFYRENHHSREFLTDTFSHEIAHKIDTDIGKHMGVSMLCETREWEDAINADKRKNGRDSPTEYGESSKAEDFAESISVFVKNPMKFKDQFPNRAQIIEKYLEER